LTPEEIYRMARQGWTEAVGDSVQSEDDDRLRGVIKEQNVRSRNVRDVVNIGSGTRCTYCGMLHFCYVEKCGACAKPMQYNMGKTERVI